MNTEINFFHLIFLLLNKLEVFLKDFWSLVLRSFCVPFCYILSLVCILLVFLFPVVLFCLECNQISVGRFDVFQERYSHLSKISPLYFFQKESLDPGYLTPQIKFTTPNRRPILKRKERWIFCLNYLSTCLSCISIPALLSEQCSC